MPKVDMSRYIECPVCHTYQITLNPCQKCVARRMAEHGTYPRMASYRWTPSRSTVRNRRIYVKGKPREHTNRKDPDSRQKNAVSTCWRYPRWDIR